MTELSRYIGSSRSLRSRQPFLVFQQSREFDSLLSFDLCFPAGYSHMRGQQGGDDNGGGVGLWICCIVKYCVHVLSLLVLWFYSSLLKVNIIFVLQTWTNFQLHSECVCLQHFSETMIKNRKPGSTTQSQQTEPAEQLSETLHKFSSVHGCTLAKSKSFCWSGELDSQQTSPPVVTVRLHSVKHYLPLLIHFSASVG